MSMFVGVIDTLLTLHCALTLLNEVMIAIKAKESNNRFMIDSFKV